MWFHGRGLGYGSEDRLARQVYKPLQHQSDSCQFREFCPPKFRKSWPVGLILTRTVPAYPPGRGVRIATLVNGRTQGPNSTGSSTALDGRVLDRLDQHFDPSAFSHPGPFQFGNVAHILSDVSGSRLSNVDLSLSNIFDIAKRIRLQVRGEFFNAFNSP